MLAANISDLIVGRFQSSLRVVVLCAICFASTAIASNHIQKKVHRVVFEVNVPGTVAYNTVLGNVTNLKKAFAKDDVQVEVVCHGEGINMLFVSNKKLAARLKQVHNSGVVFAACANTLRGKHIDKSQIVQFAMVVDAGVAEVVRKQEAGWSYIKGAF